MMNNKYKIVALFGPAGSGKDYILKNITQTPWGKISLHPIVSCTTRPPREGEKDGIDYHFIPTVTEFFSWENLHKWIEFTSFRNWWYGTSVDFLTKNKINIGVFNIKGIQSILEDKEVDCLPIKISCYNKLRLIRQLNREINPDCDEIVRRFLTDKKDFQNIPFSYKVIYNNTNEVKPVLDDLEYYIKAKWSK